MGRLLFSIFICDGLSPPQQKYGNIGLTTSMQACNILGTDNHSAVAKDVAIIILSLQFSWHK